MMRTPRLFVIVGTPGSGKDLVIQAVNDLGSQHAEIVPKHTTRGWRAGDDEEMITSDNPEFDLSKCDLVYENYGDHYGLETGPIWRGLMRGSFQVAVVSGVDAINRLREIFGGLVVLVFVHSEVSAEEFAEVEGEEDPYVVKRGGEKYRHAVDLYLREFLSFDHVLIYAGQKEDLFDQIFRLFRGYETGILR